MRSASGEYCSETILENNIFWGKIVTRRNRSWCDRRWWERGGKGRRVKLASSPGSEQIELASFIGIFWL